MSLESSTVSTSLDAIRAELTRTKLSTTTLNFVVWIDDPARRDWILERAGMLSDKHPSFTLILDHSGMRAGGATVTTSARDPHATITVDSERVDIDVSGTDTATIVGYVTGLCATNVPTVLWWSGINEASRADVLRAAAAGDDAAGRLVGRHARRHRVCACSPRSTPSTPRSRCAISRGCACGRGKT